MFSTKKMLYHEVHGRVHEPLIQLVENLPAADTFPAESSTDCHMSYVLYFVSPPPAGPLLPTKL
jgi:hypothetical protein